MPIPLLHGSRRLRRGPALLALPLLAACAQPAPPAPDFAAIRDEYFVGFLRRNPVTSTYLGGDGYSPDLAPTRRSLRDNSPEGRREEMEFYRGILSKLESIRAETLSPSDRVDAAVMRSQIRFLLHATEDRRYYRRSLDTYVVEPFRGVDWLMQQMSDLGDANYGTEAEWADLTERVKRIPGFLAQALRNLREGVETGDPPDRRMVEVDGIGNAEANATYFQERILQQAREYLSRQAHRDAVLAALEPAAAAAASAYADFAKQLEEIFLEKRAGKELVFREPFRQDRFALGEAEYDAAVTEYLHVNRRAAELFEYGAARVAETQGLMVEVARRVADRRGLRLAWDTPAAAKASVRRVMDDLSRDYPKNDEELFEAFREKARQLVAYGREKGLFDLPVDYKLDILETPPTLRDTVEGAYYPAPPFKKVGIGRFYLTPAEGDPGRLKENNFHTVADLCAHEGFPGHDWHYQFMRTRTASISNVRWLTPGAVEDSSSMWEDSMAAEGWALYAEALLTEPQTGAPEGFYTPEERLYQLQGQLLRDARVRIDTGIHTGRMSFDEAVDYYTENVDFLPGACARRAKDPVLAASCDTARKAIYRYSKWPTQAITYHLGKAAILELREEYRKKRGDRYSAKEFHERFLSQGTIPAGYFREILLQEASR
jgi:uncharacterized protein (DUF885 family)